MVTGTAGVMVQSYTEQARLCRLHLPRFWEAWQSWAMLAGLSSKLGDPRSETEPRRERRPGPRPETKAWSGGPAWHQAAHVRQRTSRLKKLRHLLQAKPDNIRSARQC